MKLRDLQTRIADALNGLEDLLKGGCKVFPEDSMTIVNDVTKQLQMAGGVAGVVLTPTLRREAGGEGGGIAVGAQVVVSFAERPAANRAHADHLTALQCAEIAALALDGDTMTLSEISQVAEHSSGTLTVSAKFDVSIILT